jgi:hypothetical protein
MLVRLVIFHSRLHQPSERRHQLLVKQLKALDQVFLVAPLETEQPWASPVDLIQLRHEEPLLEGGL